MKEILHNFLEANEQDSGLMLLPLTTGAGKTHNVLKYIAKLLTHNHEQKVFFITTQKKNLPIKKFRSIYEKDYGGNDFDARVLRIQSVTDCMKDNLTEDLVKEIRYRKPALANSSKFLMLVAVRNEMVSLNDDNNETCRTAEREFRDELLSILKKECGQKEGILQKIKEDITWNWVGKLYPMVYTSERQVFFLSMDKFMLPYDTLVNATGKLIDSEWFKGAYVFIDEFDATKETILKRIIDDKYNKINLVTLAKKIAQGLNFTEFPAVYTSTEMNFNTIKNNRENFNQLSDEFQLQYVFKTAESLNTYDSFLFHDNGYWGQTTEKSLIVEPDTSLKQNLIKNETDGTGNKTHTLYELLSKIQSKLTYFQNGVSYLAKDYARQKSVNYKTAVDSFLNLFLDRPYSDYISAQVMSVLRTVHNDRNNEISIMDRFDGAFYKTGFRYTRLWNDLYSNAEQSEVTLYAYNETPEAVMEKMAKLAKIVGISATATLKTVLGNYDIDYLQRKLLDKYYVLSQSEQKHLKSFLDKSKEHYNKTNINVEFTDISAKEYIDKVWSRIVSDDVSKQIVEELNNHYGSDSNYIKCRFYRISWAFKQFIMQDDIKSFLCFMNLHPDDSNELSKEMLTYIFDRIIGEKDKSKDYIDYLNKNDYENKLEKIKDRLNKGDKLFVISVYKTLGTGQNPQYKVPDGIDVVKINDNYDIDEKDFDAIYLDKPTNVISNLYDNSKQKWDDEDFLKFVFEMEYLCQNGDISEAKKRELINAGSKKLSGIPYYKRKDVDFESMQPYKGLVTQILNQGCGRICRTNNKSKNIYIFADRDIASVIDPTVRASIPLSPEFEKLLDELEKIGVQKSTPTLYEEKAKKIAIDTSRTISSYISWDEKWSPNKIADWKLMRLYTLKHPQPTESEFKTFPLYDMYVEAPENQTSYWYDQSEDYGKFDAISFTKKLSQEVSEEDCQLKTLMKIPGIKELFEREGFVTCWTPSKYMMSPSLYSRIYKGALGEVVGKQIFKDKINVELEDIEDSSVYEFFDYKVAGKPIYVDFKLWKEIDLGSEQSKKIRSEIFAKAKKCGAEKVLIVNIYSTSERHCKPPIPQDGCLLIEIPQLYVKYGENVKLSTDSINVINEHL